MWRTVVKIDYLLSSAWLVRITTKQVTSLDWTRTTLKCAERKMHVQSVQNYCLLQLDIQLCDFFFSASSWSLRSLKLPNVRVKCCLERAAWAFSACSEASLVACV